MTDPARIDGDARTGQLADARPNGALATRMGDLPSRNDSGWARGEPAGRMVGLARVGVTTYTNAENAHIYRPLMRLLFENRQEYGQPLSPGQLSERLRERYGIGRGVEELGLDLQGLERWGAAESQHDATRAKRASDLVRKQFIWDITPAGELTERYLEQLDSLVEQVGSLQSSRLPVILQELGQLSEELAKPNADPATLQRSLTNLVATLEELRTGASRFMRDLARVMQSATPLDEEAFHDYKSRVLEYLEGFRADLERFGGRIKHAIDAVEEQGVDRMVDLIVSLEEAPTYGISAEEARRSAATHRRNAWKGVRNWFVGSAEHEPPFALLDAKLVEAIGWILRAVQRLRERRSQRVDRSMEYRHLARLFNAAPDAECHAIFAAAFGVYAPRHFGAPEEDPELVPPQRSFWEAPVAVIETHLRNPDRRAPGQGRGAKPPDNAAAQAAMRRRREQERRELRSVLQRFSGRGAMRLSDIGDLDETAFSHLLGWLGRALEAGESADGELKAESTDGLASITLRPPVDRERRVTLETPRGRFQTPDYRLEVHGL
jgi:uncharacterized protein (TIGR02677 family)